MRKKQSRSNRILPLLLSVSAICCASASQAACEYKVDGDWPGGFKALVKLTNDGSANLTAWSVGLKYTDGATITNVYSGQVSGSNPYVVVNTPWNGSLQVGSSVEFTVMGSKVGDAAATAPTLTGDLCTGSGSSDDGDTNTAPTASVSVNVRQGNGPLDVVFDASQSSDADGDALTYSWDFGDGSTGTGITPNHTYTKDGIFVATVTVSDGQATDQASVTITVADDSTSPGDVTRVDNPFRDAKWYVNPQWSALASAEPGGSAIADQNTFVWLDRIGAIEGSDTVMGLRAHLDNALAQGANLFTVVVYDLPNRDCRARASNGELTIANGGMERYKNEYINPIAEILADPAYKDLRIVTIIELDSLPNLVTNIDVPACREASGEGGYKEGIQYALNALSPLKNVYSYIDAAHSGWLGWDSNFTPAVNMIADVVTGTNAGWESIAGFITNTANYTPTVEPFLQEPYKNIGGEVRSASFYEWNPYFDERSFAQEWRKKMIAKGAPSTIGMLIDTGRNGWGGAARPSHVSTSSSVDTYVDESRVDRRLHRGNWCNQPGGIGYKPYADPYPGIDAFVWVKPPGESDGVSEPDYQPDPDDPAKQYDSMCDPDAMNSEPHTTHTGAMDNAPHAGRWFSEGFHTLLENAYPSLDTPAGKPEE